jgi:hypothetical protein
LQLRASSETLSSDADAHADAIEISASAANLTTPWSLRLDTARTAISSSTHGHSGDAEGHRSSKD